MELLITGVFEEEEEGVEVAFPFNKTGSDVVFCLVPEPGVHHLVISSSMLVRAPQFRRTPHPD